MNRLRDGDRISDPCHGFVRDLLTAAKDRGDQWFTFFKNRRNIALKDNHAASGVISKIRPFSQLMNQLFAFFFIQPRDLERMISFHGSVGIIVDRFARSSEQSRGGVLFAQDQMCVAFTALQSNTNGHLSQRAASQRVGSTERLRAQQHMDPEGTTLSHKAVHDQRSF